MNIVIFKKFKAATFSRKAAFSEIRDQPEPYIVFSLLIAMKFEKKTKHKKKKKKEELKPWLKLNQRKTIFFLLTVANIPAFKMTHLLLAGLPR